MPDDASLPDVSLDALVKKAKPSADPSQTIADVQAARKAEETKAAPIKAQIAKDSAEGKAATQAEYDKLVNGGEVQPWKGTPPETDPVRAFGSLGSVFGILASAFTHAPWQNAMNAAAAGINAVKANDRQAYESAYEAWKDNTKLMLDRQKVQWDKYQAAMELWKTKPAEAQAALAALHAETQDKVGDALASQGLMEKYGELQMRRQETAAKMALLPDEMAVKHADALNAFDFRDAMGDLQKAMKTGDRQGAQDAITRIQAIQGRLPMTAGAGSTGSSLTPEGADLEASNRLFNGRYPPWMRSDADRKKLDNDAAAMASKLGLSMEEAATLPAEKKADAAALLADTKWLDGIKRAQTVLEGSIPIAREYMKKLPLSEIQLINAGVVRGETEFGSADANNYANAINDMALEWGRLKSGPQSAAMLPVEVIKMGMNRMGNITPDQFDGETKLIMQDANNVIHAQEKTIEDRRKALRSIVTSGGQANPGGKSDQAPKFENGKVYTDAAGNKAKFENGNWVEVP